MLIEKCWSGVSPDDRLVEIVELKNHPWFIGVQFHPELKSRPINPHPLFREFVKAAVVHSKKDNIDSSEEITTTLNAE